MLSKTETVLLVLAIAFAAALTASLIKASWTYEVELVASPDGRDVYAPLGEPFNISCKGLGGNESKFSFMKWLNPDGNAIADGTPGVVRSKNNLLYLKFTHPKTKDSGTYRCTAVYDNEYNLQYITNIHFYGPEPKFENDFENITLTEDTRENVFCFATGEKPMKYEWYNPNDDPVPENSSMPVHASSSTNGSWLIFEKVISDHRGFYTCTAKNNHGLSSKEYLINVSPAKSNNTDDGNSTLLGVKVANISASGVQFIIAVRGPVEYIEVKYSEKNNATEYLTRLTPVSESIYGISNLVPSGSYSFQFRVAPSENESWSDVTKITLLPMMPDVIIRNADGNSIKLEFYRRVGDIRRETIDKHEVKYYSIGNVYDAWVPNPCVTTIEIPACSGTTYTIAGLRQGIFYQIEVRAHTPSGFGQPAMQKVYLGP